MPTTTPIQALPIPILTDIANVPLHVQNLAQALEKQLVMIFASAAARTTAIPSPTAGMLSFRSDAGVFEYYTGAAWTVASAGMAASGLTTTTTSTPTTTTFIKDADIGNVTFSVVSTAALYRVRYTARPSSDAAPATIDIRVLDGGASSPTNVSTVLAGASVQVQATIGPGACTISAESLVTGLSVGTHIVAGFYGRTAGSGNVQLGASVGGQRVLTVERVG